MEMNLKQRVQGQVIVLHSGNDLGEKTKQKVMPIIRWTGLLGINIYSIKTKEKSAIIWKLYTLQRRKIILGKALFLETMKLSMLLFQK